MSDLNPYEEGLAYDFARAQARIKELERAERQTYHDALKLADRIEELEAKLARAMGALRECEYDIDGYIWHEYPGDHPVHNRYRKRDLSTNPARVALAELTGGRDDTDR